MPGIIKQLVKKGRSQADNLARAARPPSLRRIEGGGQKESRPNQAKPNADGFITSPASDDSATSAGTKCPIGHEELLPMRPKFTKGTASGKIKKATQLPAPALTHLLICKTSPRGINCEAPTPRTDAASHVGTSHSRCSLKINLHIAH
jgi:hypothetical protein